MLALGKRKLEGDDGSDGPAKRQNVAELYMPTMVNISISNSAVVEEGEEVQQENFQVPRGLICAYSAYYDNVFRKQFAESNTGQSAIDDIEPWVFRVFVGWLYFQRISYVEDRVEPRSFQKPVTSASMEEDPSLEETSLDLSTNSMRATGAARPPLPQPEATQQPRSDLDPMTWDWHELFQLYVFGEKYDTRSFRMKVFEIIQRKLRTKTGPKRPDAEALSYLFNNLHASSRMLDFTAKMYQDVSFHRMEAHHINNYASMPALFLARCLRDLAKYAKARECRECNRIIGKNKHSESHCKNDLLALQDLDPCTFHEHGDDAEERNRCRDDYYSWLAGWLKAQQEEPTSQAA